MAYELSNDLDISPPSNGDKRYPHQSFITFFHVSIFFLKIQRAIVLITHCQAGDLRQALHFKHDVWVKETCDVLLVVSARCVQPSFAIVNVEGLGQIILENKLHHLPVYCHRSVLWRP